MTWMKVAEWFVLGITTGFSFALGQKLFGKLLG